MKKVFIFIIMAVYAEGMYSQKKDQVYAESGGEFIFSFADVEYQGMKLNNKVRFSMFFHLGQNLHYDFSQNLGMFSGFGLRNIGFITEEDDVVTKRRTYAFGVPLALKLGSIDEHFYIYGGGEYELFFHYKMKQITGGDKNKFSQWFSDRTERFVPSLFAGVQFPSGINLKFKYYPGDFLNRNFSGTDFNQAVDYRHFSRTNLFYFALSFNLPTKKIKEMYEPGGREAMLVNSF